MNRLYLVTYLKMLFIMLVWGGTFTSAKLLGNDLAPEISAFLRFAIASVVLLALLFHREKRFPIPTANQMVSLVGMGISGIALYNLFFFFGLAHGEASRGSMITATNPLIVALGAALIFKERFTLIKTTGFILCMIGAVLIISRGNPADLFSHGIALADLAFIGCSISWATYTLFGRNIGSKLSSLATISYASVIGTILLFFTTLNSGLGNAIATLTLHSFLNLIYLSVFATVIAFIWFLDGIKILGAAKAAVFIYFMPVSALFWAYLILGEIPSVVLVVGALLIISGIYLVNKKEAVQTY